MFYFFEGNKLPEFYGVAEISQDHGAGVNEKLQFIGFSNYFSYTFSYFSLFLLPHCSSPNPAVPKLPGWGWYFFDLLEDPMM